MRYYLAPVLAPESPSPDPDVFVRDYWRLALDGLPGLQGFSAVIPTHPLTGMPLFTWGLAYVQAEDWTAVEADARLLRLFQGEEGAERSFDDVRVRLSSVRWNSLSNVRQQAIAQPLLQRGISATLFSDGPLWGLLQRVGRHLDPHFDALHTHVNRGIVLSRPDPTVGQDTFTEAVDTALSAHTPGVGAGWTVENAALTVYAAEGNVGAASTTRWMARKGDDIGDDDMDVSAPCNCAASTGRESGVCGRMTTVDLDNAYQAHLQGDLTNVDVYLYAEIAGVRSQLASYDANITPGTFATLKLEVRTAAKKVYVDGVERISSADDSLVGNQYAGLLLKGGSIVNTSIRVGDFLSESVAAEAVARQRTLIGVGL